MKAELFFRNLQPSERRKWKEAYEHIIALETGMLEIKNNRGQIVPHRGKMPWMLPLWEEGLRQLTEVMKELGELKHQNKE